MQEEIVALVEKAKESIAAAKLLLAEEHPGFAAGRAYYAMFYIAQALLLQKNLTFSKHSAVIAAFGEHFAKTMIFDTKYHRYLIDGYTYREIGDYEPLEKISRETAQNTIDHAEEMLSTGQDFLNAKP